MIKRIFTKVKISLGLALVSYLVLAGPVLLNNRNGDTDGNYAFTTLKTVAYGATVLSIPERYSYLSPGEELVVETRIREFDFNTKNDITIDYDIKDEEGNTILKQRETVAIQTQASFLKSFILPESLSYGKYTVYGVIRTLDQDILTSSNTSFMISKPMADYNPSQFALIPPKNVFLILGLLIIAGLILSAVRGRERLKVKATTGKKTGYKDLIEAIVKRGSFFGGIKFIELANRIKGLNVNEKGEVLSLKYSGLETMVNLIDLYRISIGESSIKIARKAIEDILALNPKLIVPKELKTN